MAGFTFVASRVFRITSSSSVLGISVLSKVTVSDFKEKPTVHDDPMLKLGLAGVADEIESIDEAHQPNLAGPSLAVDQYIPRMDVTVNVSRQS